MENCSIIEWLGWIVSVLALSVNYLQYRKNDKLEKKIVQIKNDKSVKQSHKGVGDNFNIGRDANIKK